MSLTKLALRRPVSMALTILALVVFGLTSIPGFRLELTPDISLPMIVVYTVYPGADPKSVEELVTKPVEAAGAEQSGVTKYTSQSSENLSIVMFQYEYGTDLGDAYMDLRPAVDALKSSMPADVKDPTVVEMAIDQMETMNISVTAVGDSDVLSYVNDTLVPELETLAGVADVTVYGGREDYIRVLLDSRAMNEYGVTMAGIAQTIGAMDFTVPVGSVSQGTQDIAISSSADISGLVQIQNIPIATAKGQLIPLSELAKVTEGLRDAESVSRYNGQENVSVAVQKKKSYGTVEVTRAVEKALQKLQASNEVAQIEVVYNASDMIVNALTSVASTLGLGVAFSMLVLFLFFGDFRASLIVGSAMPISLFATIIGMNMLGFTFNVLTLGGLVIAIGMMVDSSIVVLESCFLLKDQTGEYQEAALQGTGVVTASIIASTITTVVVYAPLSVMEGLTGQLFVQLGLTIIMAMLSSLVMALTIIPLLFRKFKPVEKKELFINRILRKVNSGYDRVLRRILPKKGLVVAVSVLLLVAAFLLVDQIDTELMPTMDEGAFAVTAKFRSGTKLEEIEAQARFLEEMAEEDPYVDHYAFAISGDEATLTGYLPKGCELKTAQVIERYAKALDGRTNMDISIEATGASMSAMLKTNLEIDLVGRDLDALQEASKQVEAMLKDIPGILQISSDLSKASTQAKIIIDPLKSMSVGLAPVQVAGELYNALSGIEAAKLKREGKEYSVRVEYPKQEHEGMNDLLNMTLATPYGAQAPLSELAAVEYNDTPVTLTRVDGLYQVAVTANTTERARFTAQDAADKAMEEMVLPKGVTHSKSMMETMMGDEFQAIITAIFVAVFLIFLVMAMQFESPRFSAMVMMSIPFALIGSFGLLYVTGTTLSMVSLMGVLMLVGIVVNNGILYVDTANRLREEMGLEEALVQSGQLRLRPILMTTLTTILSMVPMAVGSGEGAVMMRGMAMIIIGGLVASTVLILLLMPTFYLIIDKESRRQRREERRQKKLSAD